MTRGSTGIPHGPITTDRLAVPSQHHIAHDDVDDMVDVIVAYGVDIDIEEHPPSIIDPAHYLLLRVELGYARHRAEDFILLKIKIDM